jgi:hypothetical protein
MTLPTSNKERVMKLFSCILALHFASASPIFSAENNQEKSSWIEKKVDDAKKVAQKKIKRKKDKIKKIVSLSSHVLTEAELEYLLSLEKGCKEGSIEALCEASALFDVTNIYALDQALNSCLIPSSSHQDADELTLSLCGKYIGDDGLEYDDGIDEAELNELSFYSIPLHQWEKKIIEKIVSSLAEKTLAQLLLDRKEMEKRGDQVRHVHPLRFMGHVFHDPYLKSCLPQFKNSAFKWSNFVDGFVQKMREEMAKGNIVKHLEGFCDYLKIDIEKVSELVNKGQFEDLIYFLMDA